MNAIAIGVTGGLIVGLIIAAVLLKVANTDHKMKTDYDERQKAIRHKGYMYGFYAVLIYQVILAIMHMGNIEIPVDDYAIDFTGVILGCIVLCTYSIWKGVYWGMNNNPKRYYIILAICIVLNLIPIVMPAVNGTLLEDGKIGLPMLNIMVLIMMFTVLITMAVRSIADKKNSEEGED